MIRMENALSDGCSTVVLYDTGWNGWMGISGWCKVKSTNTVLMTYTVYNVYMTQMSKLHQKRVKACEIYGKKEEDGESERH